MATLQDIANGNIPAGGCNSNQNLQANQTVTILPYSPVADCQNTAPPSPSKQATALTVANLITDTCGNIILNIDNSATPSTAKEVSFGGPFMYPNQADSARVQDVALGFASAGLIINIEGGPVPIAGSTFFGGTNGFGLAYVNYFTGHQEALLVSRIWVQRALQTTTANADLINTPFKPYTVGEADTYNVTPSGAEVFAQITSTGSGDYVDAIWDFGFCGGLPMTQTTGALFTIPAGYVGKLGICIKAHEGNILFNEGC